jgi:hypothetical protein
MSVTKSAFENFLTENYQGNFAMISTTILMNL